jgi:CHASE2 domain-containing sensor protein
MSSVNPIRARRAVPRFLAIIALATLAINTIASMLPGVLSSAHATEAPSRFVVVNFDAAAARKFGDFPSRAAVADVLQKINAASPKAVSLKFFYDSPGVAADTDKLAAAMAQGRVLLQASINAEPPTSSHLDARFFFAGNAAGTRPAPSGKEGWLPIAKLAQKAAKVCFVDSVKPEQAPMLERFQDKPVKTMYACLLEEAYAAGELTFERGAARFGDHQLRIDDTGSALVSTAALQRKFASISAADVMDAKSPLQALQGKVVIVIYTGVKSPTIAVGGSAVKVHEVFVAQLRALEESLITVRKN